MKRKLKHGLWIGLLLVFMFLLGFAAGRDAVPERLVYRDARFKLACNPSPYPDFAQNCHVQAEAR